MHALTAHPLATPSSDRDTFLDVAGAAVRDFSSNSLFSLIDSGRFSLTHHHGLLTMLFHQTYETAATFAMAAAHCEHRHQPIRDYLIEHAEEERTHWRWILEDLEGTGYTGQDPRSRMSPLECQNYTSFNIYLAVRVPIARLATAAVLEGIGATYAKAYSDKICGLLNISPTEVQFAYGHGDTDVGHAEDIHRVLSEADLSGYEWAWCVHAARIAGILYRTMYEAAARCL